MQVRDEEFAKVEMSKVHSTKRMILRVGGPSHVDSGRSSRVESSTLPTEVAEDSLQVAKLRSALNSVVHKRKSHSCTCFLRPHLDCSWRRKCTCNDFHTRSSFELLSIPDKEKKYEVKNCMNG